VDTSALTAIGNDYGFEQVFARQVQALGRPGDVVVAISTSGRSRNVVAGVDVARQQRLTTIGLTGGDGGLLAGRVDIPIVVPSTITARIQECHITIGHILCELVGNLVRADEAKRKVPEAQAASPEIALARLQPDIHCKGAEYAPPQGKPVPEADAVVSYGGRIEFLPMVPSNSTTDLVRRIREMSDGGTDATRSNMGTLNT
jgi:hypothetical protein